MHNKLLLIFCLVMILSITGCGSDQKHTDSPIPNESTQPLLVEYREFDYDGFIPKTPGDIQKSEGYFMQECLTKSLTSQAEWDMAMEPFTDTLSIKVDVASFDFEGKEQLLYIEGIYRDKQGYSYVVADNTIFVIDFEGKKVGEHNYGSADLSYSILEPIISDNGDLVFPIFNVEDFTVDIVNFDRITGKKRLLGSVEEMFSEKPLCALWGSSLFYRSNDWIIKWDLLSGDREQYFNLKQIGANDRHIILSNSTEGVPLIYVGEYIDSFKYVNSNATQDELIVTIGYASPKAELTIRISDVIGNFDNGFIASSVGKYQVTKPKVSFDYQTDEDEETHRTRVMAELASGNGADILCVSQYDMMLLWKKGAILSMEDLISEDTLNSLLPGVLELCRVDGEIVGMAPLVFVTGLATAKSEWEKESWTMQEFMEKTRSLNKQYGWVGIKGSSGFSSCYHILNYAGIPSLESMGLIDFEKGIARLDSAEYMDMLEFCMEYGMKNDLSDYEYRDCMINKNSMGNVAGFIAGYGYYENLVALYEEGDANILGFPAGETSSNYLDSIKYLVVTNQVADNPRKLEETSAFIEYILSDSSQKNIQYYISVRRPTKETCYEVEQEYESGEPKKEIYFFEEIIRPQHLKADGTTYLQEYMDFLDNCRGKPAFTPVQGIILEEVQYFFEGGKSAEETAKITQNRVQLYLDENN